MPGVTARRRYNCDMGKEKFIVFSIKNGVVGFVAGAMICVEPGAHVHHDGPVWPAGGYGMQATVTGTSTSTSTSTRGW